VSVASDVPDGEMTETPPALVAKGAPKRAWCYDPEEGGYYVGPGFVGKRLEWRHGAEVATPNRLCEWALDGLAMVLWLEDVPYDVPLTAEVVDVSTPADEEAGVSVAYLLATYAL
jgi:hypothetical protein